MKSTSYLGLILAASVSSLVLAGEIDKKTDAAIRQGLQSAMPGLVVSDIQETQIPGLYEVNSNNGAPLFSNIDGSYFVAGELYSTKGGRVDNLTEKSRAKSRSQELAGISEKDEIVFMPEGEVKATVNVFTDVDCGYCRKLHKEVPKMNAMGIKVKYLAFPRAGIGSTSYKKIVSAWCSDDPKQALTLAKLGKTIPGKTCENPVAEQYKLGQRLGVTGTPSIILDNGQIVGGYLSADALAKGLGLL